MGASRSSVIPVAPADAIRLAQFLLDSRIPKIDKAVVQHLKLPRRAQHPADHLLSVSHRISWQRNLGAGRHGTHLSARLQIVGICLSTSRDRRTPLEFHSTNGCALSKKRLETKSRAGSTMAKRTCEGVFFGASPPEIKLIASCGMKRRDGELSDTLKSRVVFVTSTRRSEAHETPRGTQVPSRRLYDTGRSKGEFGASLHDRHSWRNNTIRIESK